jgi:hypothetical protein
MMENSEENGIDTFIVQPAARTRFPFSLGDTSSTLSKSLDIQTRNEFIEALLQENTVLRDSNESLQEHQHQTEVLNQILLERIRSIDERLKKLEQAQKPRVTDFDSILECFGMFRENANEWKEIGKEILENRQRPGQNNHRD